MSEPIAFKVWRPEEGETIDNAVSVESWSARGAAQEAVGDWWAASGHLLEEAFVMVAHDDGSNARLMHVEVEVTPEIHVTTAEWKRVYRVWGDLFPEHETEEKALQRVARDSSDAIGMLIRQKLAKIPPGPVVPRTVRARVDGGALHVFTMEPIVNDRSVSTDPTEWELRRRL